MTYREAIQIQIRALMEVYDNCGALRDYATLEDKEDFNFVRRKLPAVWKALQEIDDNTDIGDQLPNGNYCINIKND